MSRSDNRITHDQVKQLSRSLPPSDMGACQAAADLQHEHNIKRSDTQIETMYGDNQITNKLWGGRSLLFNLQCTVCVCGQVELLLRVQPLL